MRASWHRAVPFAAAALLAGSVGAAEPASQPPLQPSGKWVVDYDKDMCVLQRRFGDGPTAVSLGFKPVPLSAQVEVVLVQPSTDTLLFRQGKGALVIDGRTVVAPFASYYLAALRKRLVSFYPDVSIAAVIGASNVTLTGDGGAPLSLAPHGAPAAMTAIDRCQDDLLTTWGVDVAQVKALKSLPQPSAPPASFFRPDDYPTAAIRANEMGRDVALATVGAQGAVTSCRITVRATPLLDAATCSVLTRRAHFLPAIDTNGKPAVGWAAVAVTWAIPNH